VPRSAAVGGPDEDWVARSRSFPDPEAYPRAPKAHRGCPRGPQCVPRPAAISAVQERVSIATDRRAALDHRPGVGLTGDRDVGDSVVCAVPNLPGPSAIVGRLDRPRAAGSTGGRSAPEHAVLPVPKGDRAWSERLQLPSAPSASRRDQHDQSSHAERRRSPHVSILTRLSGRR
jgi:hypothetical protein